MARAAGRRRAGARRGRGADGAASAQRVRFAGAVPHAELPALYAAADLYLWPAINEAYGMAFLEAQAAGLPVVAGRTGGVPAVVADGVTGLLTPIGDAAAFAAAVARLLDAPGRARAPGAPPPRARVAAHHDERAAAHALATALDACGRAAMSAVPFAILRHAPTDWNAAGRLQGLTDTCLSPEGEAAARQLAPAGAGRRLAADVAVRCSARGARPSCCSPPLPSPSTRRCAR